MNNAQKELVKKKIFGKNIFDTLVNKTFEENDINQSGFIEKDDLAVLLKKIYGTLNFAPPNDSEITKELKRLDKDRDGKLNKAEYAELIQELIISTIDQL